MDARNPTFLEGHIEPGSSRFEVMTERGPVEAICNGVLQVSGAVCQYIARATCDEDLVVEKFAPYRLELDMYVAELAGLDVRFDRLDRERSPIATLWIDQTLVDALPRLDPGDRLVARGGNCTFVGEVTASDRERMQAIVDVMTAIAMVPHRRVEHLVAALAGCEIRALPARLAIDGDGVAILGAGGEVVVDVALASSIDGSGLRTRVRAPRNGGPALVVVDAKLPRKHRPRASFVDLGDWLATSRELSDQIRATLATARPAAIVAGEHEVAVALPGFVADPVRLTAAIDCVRRLVAARGDAPYR